MSESPAEDKSQNTPDKGEIFTRLLISNRDRIFAFIYALTHDRTAANDVFQEVSTVLWRKFDQFDQSTDFACWAMAVARLSVFEWRRSLKKKHNVLTDEQLSRLADEATAVASEQDERMLALRDCLKSAPPRDRELLQERYFKDNSVSSIAESQERSRMAIYKRLNRIHAQLLECVRHKLQMEAVDPS